jgi:hypothetical protein
LNAKLATVHIAKTSFIGSASSACTMGLMLSDD